MARLYGASRLYVNFFQPSFKLKEKWREGSKIPKSYFSPVTPSDRLVNHPNVSYETKAALKHQRERYWRTRIDPFANVWHEAENWLEQNPEGNGKQLFDVLCESHPGQFKPVQLRTLQRRIKEWRAQKAQSLILPGGLREQLIFG